MKSIKGPAIFLAQFVGDEPPFNTFDSICGWAASLGYKGVQIPAWDDRFIDLEKAADNVGYCQELIGTAGKHGVAITELATHLRPEVLEGLAARLGGVERMEASDIAETIAFIVTRPRRVAVNEVLIRPTEQDS